MHIGANNLPKVIAQRCPAGNRIHDLSFTSSTLPIVPSRRLLYRASCEFHAYPVCECIEPEKVGCLAELRVDVVLNCNAQFLLPQALSEHLPLDSFSVIY